MKKQILMIIITAITVNIYAADTRKDLLLVDAFETKNYDKAEQLLRDNPGLANVNLKSYLNSTKPIIFHFISAGDDRAVKLLFNYGASVDASVDVLEEGNKITPLIYASMICPKEAIFKMLLDAGSDKTVKFKEKTAA